MAQKKFDALTTKEQTTLRRLEKFAQRNNLTLFNVKGSLYDRIRTIIDSNGACPCFPDTRKWCPCKEVIQECKEKGECECRVFIRQK